jgi:hypothetical protein
MAEQAAFEWRELGDDLAIAVLPIPTAPVGSDPAPEDDPDHPRFRLFASPFSAIIMVQVKSDSETGRAAHNDLLGFLNGEGRIPDQLKGLLPENPRFMLLRANAEVPANPVRRTALLAVSANPGTVVGVEWKDDPKAVRPREH